MRELKLTWFIPLAHDFNRYIFCNVNPEMGWAMRARAVEASAELTEKIKDNLPITASGPVVSQSPHQNMDTQSPDYKTLGFKGYIEARCLEFLKQRLTMELEPIRRAADDAMSYFSEFSDKGEKLRPNSARTFLVRMKKSNRMRCFREMGPLHRKNKNSKKEELIEKERETEERRTIANVLGLTIVTSIHYSQGLSRVFSYRTITLANVWSAACAEAVDFYLHPDREQYKIEIIRLSKLEKNEEGYKDVNKKIMGYIREAQSLVINLS